MNYLNGMARFFRKSGKLRMQSYLMRLPTSQLIAWGYSPTQLSKGISAWPWRLEDQPMAASSTETAFTAKQLRASVKELQSFSNAELADMGLNRGTIEHAVRYGRQGLENDKTSQAA